MAAYKDLRETHPQKLWLKFLCDFLYYTGLGVCWYEKPNLTPLEKRFYKVWCVISNIYIFLGMLNQYLAYFRSDLNEKEKIDLFQFTFGNTVITLKILVYYLQKNRITQLLEIFLEDFREFSSIELERSSVKKGLKYCSFLFAVAYATMVFTLVESLVGHVKEGTPIRTEVTIYPTSNTPKVLYNVLRLLIEVHWYYAVTIVVVIDSICVFCLVFLGFKFKRLRLYFEELRIKCLENSESNTRSTLEKEYEIDFINGIKLHEHALWCARNVQYALGNLYSLQVVESLIMLVVSLIKTVTSEHNLAILIANLCYFACVVMFTGAYMMAGGDVTNEAALVPMSIFHSGWELNRARKGLRTLAVVALINSQVPVLMTAFGIISLSYTNFLMILRHSYSFFAVMY